MKLIKKLKFNCFLATFIALSLIGCDTEGANDCLQTEGDTLTEEISLPLFDKIRIEEGVTLIIQQGETQKVLLETGENLRNDVSVSVEDDTLVARDNNSCNLFRDYGVTKITVTSPNIVDILNGSSFEVRSDGVLKYPTLRLRSLTIVGLDLRKNGSFFLDVESESLSITANGSSVFYITGTTENLNVSFADEIPRLEARDLIAQNVTLRHVSGNHMFINPQQSLKAELIESGNVYSSNKPPTTEIIERYTGRVIFID